MLSTLSLRYGMNPYQDQARILVDKGEFPFKILNGSPGFINFLDALNGWQLVRELRSQLGLPAAASFKHASPAGAAVAMPLDDALKKAYWVDGRELSPLATAYARARGADRISSFGDFIALSDEVDESTAELIGPEVSDGIIAPSYSSPALARLRSKKKGSYIILQMDQDYEPPVMERRTVFGISLEQRRNDRPVGSDLLTERPTQSKDIPAAAKTDLVLALVTLKYTQSNSVCLTYHGQVIGSWAGQQSRIHCTQLAAGKADRWYLRQHPYVLGLRFKKGLRRPTCDNAIDQFLSGTTTESEKALWPEIFERVPEPLTEVEKHAWLQTLQGVSLGSDAYFPFDDSIHRAAASGVRYVVQPGGSVRDELSIRACDGYGMVMAFSRHRLFHH